jgi:DNA replication protein DnaD
MLKKVYELGCLNLEKLILKYTKDLSLSSEECLILLKIVENITAGKDINEEDIAKSLKLDAANVSNVMAKFIEQGYLELDVVIEHGICKEKYSIDSLFKALEVILNDEMKENKSESEDIISLLETKFSRVLSSKELEIVSSWENNNITKLDVEEACRQLLARDFNLSINRIEKELFKLTRSKGTSTADTIDRLLEKSRNGYLS